MECRGRVFSLRSSYSISGGERICRSNLCLSFCFLVNINVSDKLDETATTIII